MQSKHIGLLLIVLGVIVAGITTMMQSRENQVINDYVDAQGTCYLTDGTCLHADRNDTPYIIGYVVAAALALLGAYLLFFDKTYEHIMRHNKEITEALHDAKKSETFSAYLAGFTDEEQTVLKAVKEQEGIQQSTLRLRVGMSKSSLSLLLSSLEKRQIISRKEAGKTNKVYLRKRF